MRWYIDRTHQTGECHSDTLYKIRKYVKVRCLQCTIISTIDIWDLSMNIDDDFK